jgi:hypothetical protein
VHVLYLAGALYARGVGECWRDDSQALAYADRLEALKLKLYEMSADQLRMIYYGNRGNLHQFERYRHRVEVHAIQRGTAWQVETWTFSGMITVYLRTQDVAGMKDCVVQLKRLSSEIASLRIGYSRALAAYLVLRGTPSEALEIAGRGERPMELVGWSRGEGLKARAYNELGEHARAKETCIAALAYLTASDLVFCALNLGLQIELARAEAGLGQLDTAETQLRALLATYGPGANPLTVGALHEALAELAALRGDAAAFAEHLDEVGRWFRETRDPALVARHQRLARTAIALASPSVETSYVPGRSSSPPRMMTVMHRLRHGGDHTRTGSADWALRQLLELTNAQDGYLFLAEGTACSCAARVGANEDEEVVATWAAERIAAFSQTMEAETCATTETTDPTRLEVGSRVYRITVLASHDAGAAVTGAVVLTGSGVVPAAVVQTIVERLASTPAVSTSAPPYAIESQ